MNVVDSSAWLEYFAEGPSASAAYGEIHIPFNAPGGQPWRLRVDTAGLPYNCSAGQGAPIERLEGGMNRIFSSYSRPLESGDATPLQPSPISGNP